jgi:hypothetical protein
MPPTHVAKHDEVPSVLVDRAKAAQVSMPCPVSLAVSSTTSGLVGWAALALFSVGLQLGRRMELRAFASGART